VGKVYAICLYIENYRSYKQGHTNDTVSLHIAGFFLYYKCIQIIIHRESTSSKDDDDNDDDDNDDNDDDEVSYACLKIIK
jgi:hypothetical protein